MNKINGDAFSFKNKIFKISWVFEPSKLIEWDKKCYVYNNFIKNSKWLVVNSGLKKVISMVVSN